MKFIKKENSFVLIEEGVKLAEITWEQKDKYLYVDHTYVDVKLRGQKIAEKLVDEVVSYAEKNNFKIIPVCSYVVSKFEDEKYKFIDGRIELKDYPNPSCKLK